MNVHPIFVHFPIALLSTYGILELIRFKKITSQAYWFYIKATLVILGTLAAYVAAEFGDIAKGLIVNSGNRTLISNHENWAQNSIIIFTIIAVCYAIEWLNKATLTNFKSPTIIRIWNWLTKIQHWIIDTPVVIILAIAGVIAITITGSLGGTIVYGKGNDPITDWIVSLILK
ncbi:MAG: hypothetical protein JWO40_313 [Candidatus Doudnabacteria bacterium]|nr:hypothetical protein [Candidatus Doudnabacteria bacterium]